MLAKVAGSDLKDRAGIFAQFASEGAFHGSIPQPHRARNLIPMLADDKSDAEGAPELQVGAWTVRSAANELLRDGEVVQVEPKVMALLVYLAERANQVIVREHVFEALWSGVLVGDGTLIQVVIKLRKALGDDAQSGCYIQTISKEGYRLRAPVRVVPPTGRWIRPRGLVPTRQYPSCGW